MDRIQKEIRNRALLLIEDNPSRVGDLNFVETAMRIGASIVMEQPITESDNPIDNMTPEAEEALRQLFEGRPEPDNKFLETIEDLNRMPLSRFTPVVPRSP